MATHAKGDVTFDVGGITVGDAVRQLGGLGWGVTTENRRKPSNNGVVNIANRVSTKRHTLTRDIDIANMSVRPLRSDIR